MQVTLDGKALHNVNELEWVKGEIFANVWQTNWIVRIDPGSGRVVGVINLAGLLKRDRFRRGTDRRAERHRLRREARSPVRHRQELAETIRDSSARTHRDSIGRSLHNANRTPTRGRVPDLHTIPAYVVQKQQ